MFSYEGARKYIQNKEVNTSVMHTEFEMRRVNFDGQVTVSDFKQSSSEVAMTLQKAFNMKFKIVLYTRDYNTVLNSIKNGSAEVLITPMAMRQLIYKIAEPSPWYGNPF